MDEQSSIHPTALVAAAAQLDSGVTIGAGCVIEAGAQIGAGTTLGAYVIVRGGVSIGRRNQIGSFTTMGDPPQDTKHDPAQPGRLVIGDNNRIREHCSLHSGCSYTSGITKVGDDNFVMCYCHLAHDGQLGSGNILANGVSLGGHVLVGNNTVFGAHVKVAQFGRIGSGCMIGESTSVHACVPSYWMVAGARARAYGINRVGMRRLGMSVKQIDNVRRAFRLANRPGSLEQRREAIAAYCAPGQEIDEILDSMTGLPKGIVGPPRSGK